MGVLKGVGKSCFGAIIPARRFTNGAGRGIEEKRAVVGFAVVVARSAKAQRASKNQERRGEWPPVMLRVDERRIERRQIRSPGIVGIFEGAKRGIDAKATEHNNNGENLDPPRVSAQSTAEAGLGRQGRGTRNRVTSEVAVG